MAGSTTDIVMVIGELTGGGTARVVSNLAREWSDRGKKVEIITFDDGKQDAYPLPPTVKRTPLGGLESSRHLFSAVSANLSRVSKLRKALKRSGSRKVIGFIGPTNILVILASMGLGMQVVISERNDPARQSFGRMWDKLRVLLYRRADLVTANSAGALKTLSLFVESDKLLLVPNPVSRPLDAAEPLEKRGKVILSVGRLHQQKAYDILLQSFAEFRKDFPGWTLSILGDGGLKQALKQQADELHIAEAVIFHGQVSDPFSYYGNADIFAMPSRHEGMPNALMEAMSQKLPVIVSDASEGPLELIKQGDAGLVVPVENVSALTAAMVSLAKDDDLRNDLAEKAQKAMADYAAGPVRAAWDKAAGF